MSYWLSFEDATMRIISALLLMLVTIWPAVSDAGPAPEMTPEQADAVLNKYITPNDNRGGLCLIGFNPGATLDYGQPASATNAKIEFVGKFGKPLLFGKALVGTGEGEVQTQRTVVDAKQLKKIRIINKRVENLRTWCPNVKPQYLVVLYPKDSLPSDAEISINVNSSNELDELVDALKYLSPNARLKGKLTK